MCGRYFIDPSALDALLGPDAMEPGGQGAAIKTQGEVFPTDAAPVLARSRAGHVKPFAMRWGFSVAGSRRLINARSETAAELATFSGALQSRRCLVPASGYYEWLRHDRRKDRYALRAPGGEPLMMAGLYRFEGNAPVFVILTRASAGDAARLHDRMPVILSGDAAKAWLCPDADARELLLCASGDVTAERAPQRADTQEPEQMSFLEE